jgi:hypothetical protein
MTSGSPSRSASGSSRCKVIRTSCSRVTGVKCAAAIPAGLPARVPRTSTRRSPDARERPTRTTASRVCPSRSVPERGTWCAAGAASGWYHVSASVSGQGPSTPVSITANTRSASSPHEAAASASHARAKRRIQPYRTMSGASGTSPRSYQGLVGSASARTGAAAIFGAGVMAGTINAIAGGRYVAVVPAAGVGGARPDRRQRPRTRWRVEVRLEARPVLGRQPCREADEVLLHEGGRSVLACVQIRVKRSQPPIS